MKVVFPKLFLIILIGCTLSCKPTNHKNVKYFDGFSKISELDGFVISIPPFLKNPSKISIVDTNLIVFQKVPDSIVTILDLKSNTIVASFGSQGNGPNEFSNSSQNYFMKFESQQKGFTVGNKANNLQFYKLEDVIHGNYLPYKIERVPPKAMRIRGASLLNDTMLFAASYIPDIHIFSINFLTGQFKPRRMYPKSLPLMNIQNIREVFGCYCTAKPDNSKVAITYAFQGCIEIIDLKANMTVAIVYERFPELFNNLHLTSTSESINRNDARIFSWEIRSTDQFIYVKVYDRKYDDLIEEGAISTRIIPDIHVFTWQGEPVMILKLDRYYKTFDVDPLDQYLITIDEYIDNQYVKYFIEMSHE